MIDYYENDVLDIILYISSISKYIKNSIVSYRDYSKEQICCFKVADAFDYSKLELQRFVDSDSDIYDIKITNLTKKQISEIRNDTFQSRSLSFGFFVAGFKKGAVYFEKLDDFKINHDDFTSVSEVLERYNISCEKFYADRLQDGVPTLKALFDSINKINFKVDDCLELGEKKIDASNTFN